MNDSGNSVTIDNHFAQIPHWVLLKSLSSNAIHLYVILVKYANWQSKEAYPSRATLANLMGCTVRTLDRAKDELVAAGALIYKKRFIGNVPTSNLYHVITASPVESNNSLGGVKNDTKGGVKNDTKGEVKNDILTRPIINDNQSLTKKIDSLNDFEKFWEIYPRHASKSTAMVSFQKALKKTTLEIIIESAFKYSNDPNREERFTAHASTWLNQERWDDDLLPSNNQSKPKGQTFLENFRQEREVTALN